MNLLGKDSLSGCSETGFVKTQFLGTLAKLRKAAITFTVSVSLSVRMAQVGSHWTDCHGI